jgi:hypothetical protein
MANTASEAAGTKCQQASPRHGSISMLKNAPERSSTVAAGVTRSKWAQPTGQSENHADQARSEHEYPRQRFTLRVGECLATSGVSTLADQALKTTTTRDTHILPPASRQKSTAPEI